MVPLQRLLLLHPVSAGAHPGEMKPSMEHMTTFVLTMFLFFFPENRSLPLLQVIYDARVDWWVYFFSPEAQKEFCWIAFDWQYSMSAAITYLNGPLNLDCVITVDARLCSYFWKNVERDCKCHLKGNLWQEGKCIIFFNVGGSIYKECLSVCESTVAILLRLWPVCFSTELPPLLRKK